MRSRWLFGLFLASWLFSCPPVRAALRPTASSYLLISRRSIRAHHSREAIEQLYPALEKPGFDRDPEAPLLLLTLGDQAEAYVRALNQRYWKRPRLDPDSPSWRSFIRHQRRWAEHHLAAFDYDDSSGRYRSLGDAYKLLLAKFPKHPLAEEATWRLLQLSRPPSDHRSDPALRDAARYRRFLRRYPRSPHRLAAKLTIGWDYLYASGFTWGQPDRALFRKGEQYLRSIMRDAPASPEAKRAHILLNRTKNPFGYSPVGPSPGR